MIADLPFTLEALPAYRGGLRLSDIVDEAFRRIAAPGDLGVFLHLIPRERARTDAEALGAFDPDGPLRGAPFAVKDKIDVTGCLTTAGCPAFACRPDAVVVSRLRLAGAIPTGKTNLDQFATGPRLQGARR